MIKKIILFSLFFLLYVNGYAIHLKTPEKKNSSEISFTYIIPGLGQIKRGYYIKGGLLFTSFVSAITGAIIENRKGNDYYNIYINSTDLNEIINSRINSENHFKKRNYYIIGGFSVWIVNLIDLRFFSKKNKGIKGEIKKNYISFGFYYIF